MARYPKSKKITKGKMFRTKKGRYGCYIYVNGRRSHFEPKYEAPPRYKRRY